MAPEHTQTAPTTRDSVRAKDDHPAADELTLTAEWMTARADPIVLSEPQESARRTEQTVSIGGRLIELTADRRKYSLYVPPGAIGLSADIEMVAITALPGLPVADSNVGALRIKGLSEELRRGAVLTVQMLGAAPSQQSPNTMFIVDPATRELSLTPSASLDGGKLQSFVARDGIYGVANITDDERQSVLEHRPSSAEARLLNILSTQLRDETPDATAGMKPGFWFLSAAWAQESADFLPPEAASMVQALREYYDQKLMPRLELLGRGCSETERELLMELNTEILHWMQGAQFIGLLGGDDEPVPVSAGQTPAEFRLQVKRYHFFRELQQEFERREQRLITALDKGLERMQRAVSECCRKHPERWMPAFLASLKRNELLTGMQADSGDSLAEAQRCACAVAAVHDSVGWVGSITQTDEYSGESRTATSRSRSTTHENHRYTLELTLLGTNEDGSALAIATSSAERKHRTDIVDTDWACAVDERGSAREITNARGAASGQVGVTVRKDNSYMISFPRPVAFGLETHRQYRKREGCKNKFNDGSANDVSMRQGSVATDYNETVHGKTDVALELRGSLTATPPETHRRRKRTATVKWDIRACSVP